MYSIYSLSNENLSFGMAIIDSNFAIKRINSKFAHILHRDQADLLGKKMTDLLPEIKGFSLGYNQLESKKITRNNGQTLVLDVIKDGQKVTADYFIFCRDDTEYEQISQQYGHLNEQIQLYIQMLDKLHDGIFITDADGIVLYVNESFLNLSGLQKDVISSKSVYELMETGIVPNSCLARVIRSKEPITTINNYYQGKSCLVSGTPIFNNGELARAIAVVRDLTELQSLQNQLENVTSLNISYKHKLKEIETKSSNVHVIETRSKSMQTIYDKAIKIAAVDSPVLLTGETGVGKDFLAKFIHEISECSKTGCMIKVNCGAIPDNLLESELFGYEKGAFTGANKDGKAGLFELASHGTLYLDEIGDMPIHLQVKLLSCIQDKKFFRVGGTKIINLQARIIAATNVDLEKLIAERRFRQDLYYRLNVINIQIPSLQNRRDDIIPLALRFLDEFNHHYNKSCYFSPKTMALLLNYAWPGNIREMKNIIERVVIMSDQNCLEPSCLEENIRSSLYSNDVLEDPISNLRTNTDNQSLKERLENFESLCIKETLDSHNSLKESADALGIDLSTLVRKKQKYGLSRKSI